MKLECLNPKCRKTFLYAAKKATITYPPLTEEFPHEFGLNPQTVEAVQKPLVNISIERHVCPYCESLDIQEVSELLESVKSVDLSEVDTYLKDGYVVHDLYAKTATMKKVKT